MREIAATHGVRLRPHVKTAKSVRVAELALGDAAFRGITVSTLAEAEHFASAGFTDLTYAVGLVPAKVLALEALAERGVSIGVITDDASVATYLAARRAPFAVWLEIDCGAGRGGLDPEGSALLELARIVDSAPGPTLAGVLTHAGHSYRCRGPEAIAEVAEQERAAAVRAAERIRGVGVACDGVSVGSTPTMMHARDLSGVTEIRPGVYVFFDRFQAAIGACGPEDLALSVVASVVTTRGGAPWIDAGALALSSDRSMDAVGYGGYGAVTALDGAPLPGRPRVAALHQEHGRLEATEGALDPDALPVGQLVRVWPNHACMTAAMYDAYDVLDAGEVVDRWPRLRG